jgi:hypothetical protein
MTDSEREILGLAIERYGAEAQTDMAIEEMSELTKALLKYRRSQHGDKTCGNNLVGNIVEEIEDVQIMLDQMMLIYGRDEATRCMKIARLRERLKEAGNNDRDNQS